MSQTTSWLLVFSLVVFFQSTADAQDGHLDSTFASNGVVTNIIGSTAGIGYSGAAHSVLVQGDGKIIAAGFSGDGNETFFAMVRYNSNGTVDTSFGTNGIVTTAIGPTDDEAYSATLESDGKIILGGFSSMGGLGSQRVFALVRYDTNGAVDSSFGKNGVVTTAIGTADDEISSIVMQTDGKIIAAGYSYKGFLSNGDTYYFAMTRYTSNGTLDSTFGTKGVVTMQIQPSTTAPEWDLASSVALQSDGKILVAGTSGDGIVGDFAVVRLNPDGTPDNTFGSYGTVLTSLDSGEDGAASIVVQSDGRIVVGGHSESYFAACRYSSNGDLDPTFGTGGKVITAIGHSSDAIKALIIQGDGRIVATGFSVGNGIALVRYNVDGSIDTTFGKGGASTMDSIGWGGDRGFAAAIQSDGKFVIAGTAMYNNFYNLNEFVIARYTDTSKVGVNAIVKAGTYPATFEIYQNYPNPFNPTTVISYKLPSASHVTLKVYDVLGRTVVTLIDGEVSAGYHQAILNGSEFASGVYFYRLTTPTYTKVMKMLLIK